jgi:peptidoglycan/LPS O-acetylase OafA/YrhL
VIIRKKIYGIQYCRAVAAIFVVLYHVGTTAEAYNRQSIFSLLFNYGKYGVDFFFVISGFIIFNAHFEDIGVKGKSIIYIKKRFFRIYPIYFIILTIKVLIFLCLSIQIPENQKSFGYFLNSYLLLPIENQYPFLSVAWTLSFELTFYTYFLLAMKMQRRTFFLLTLGWMLLIIFYNINNLKYNFILNHLLNSYNIEFIIGVFASLIYREQKFLNTGLKLVAIIFLLFLFLDKTDSDLLMRIVLGGCFGIIVLVSANFSKITKIPHSNFIDKTLQLIGNASYSIYLVHTLVITAIYKTLINLINIDSLGFITLIFSLIIGITFWKFIESPLLKFTKDNFIK